MIKKIISIMMFSAIISNTGIAQSKEEKEVAAAVEDLRKAMVDGDSVALDHLSMSELSYGHSSGLVQAKPDFIHSFTNGSTDFVTIELTNQTIQVFNDVAIVRHTLIADNNDNGKPGHVKLAILLVWHKEKHEWKLLARQAVKLQ